jgi:hypothetical protein
MTDKDEDRHGGGAGLYQPTIYLWIAAFFLIMGTDHMLRWYWHRGILDLVFGLTQIAAIPMWLIYWRHRRSGI